MVFESAFRAVRIHQTAVKALFGLCGRFKRRLKALLVLCGYIKTVFDGDFRAVRAVQIAIGGAFWAGQTLQTVLEGASRAVWELVRSTLGVRAL